MPTVELYQPEKDWLMKLRKETPGKDRTRESVASVVKRLHEKIGDEIV